MRLLQFCRLVSWLVIAPLLLGGCSILREFGPVVEVHTLTAEEAIELKRSDILTRGKLSDATTQSSGIGCAGVRKTSLSELR